MIFFNSLKTGKNTYLEMINFEFYTNNLNFLSKTMKK